MSVPQGEVSITRLAAALFWRLALMFSLGALIVAARDMAPGPMAGH
jgi:hypothetical protein